MDIAGNVRLLRFIVGPIHLIPVADFDVLSADELRVVATTRNIIIPPNLNAPQVKRLILDHRAEHLQLQQALDLTQSQAQTASRAASMAAGLAPTAALGAPVGLFALAAAQQQMGHGPYLAVGGGLFPPGTLITMMILNQIISKLKDL